MGGDCFRFLNFIKKGFFILLTYKTKALVQIRSTLINIGPNFSWCCGILQYSVFQTNIGGEGLRKGMQIQSGFLIVVTCFCFFFLKLFLPNSFSLFANRQPPTASRQPPTVNHQPEKRQKKLKKKSFSTIFLIVCYDYCVTSSTKTELGCLNSEFD